MKRNELVEIYLDNCATTKPLAEANEAFMNTVLNDYGNPSSLHMKGFEAEKLVDLAKEEMAAALGCKAGELIFTASATEANNLAILGGIEANKRNGKKIVISAVEHPSVLRTVRHLEKNGYEVVLVYPSEAGGFTAGAFADEVDENTVLVAAMWVNNETGLILPIEEIAKAVKNKNANTLMLCDGVQGFLKIPINISKTKLDFMSVSGHKVGTPKGIGALYIKSGVRVVPLIHGGGQQEGLRSGTEPVPLIAAFGGAVKAQKDKLAETTKHYEELKLTLKNLLIADERVVIHDIKPQAPHVVSLAVKGVRSEIMLHFLEGHGIYISSGSACKKGKESHVLPALGIKKELADETLRVSFSKFTTKEEITEFIDKLILGLEGLQKSDKKEQVRERNYFS